MSRVRFLFDEDFNGHIVRGLRRRHLHVDARTVREAGLGGASDEAVLEWAAVDHRLVVSHDRRTMAAVARARIRGGRPMAGLILLRQDRPVAVAIEELAIVSEATRAEEWCDVIAFFPL